MERALILILFCFAAHRAIAQESAPIILPPEAGKALTARFGPWNYAEATEEQIGVVRWFNPDAWPYLIRGDFDDNGVADYAVHVTYNDSVSGARRGAIVALLSVGAEFNLHTLEHTGYYPGGGDYHFSLVKKGSWIECYDCDREPIRLERDAILPGYFEKPYDGAYVFKGSAFVFLNVYED